MTRYRVLPYRQGSKSAKALATALSGKILKLEGSTFVPQSSDLIINWGNTTTEFDAYTADCLNYRDNIRQASNKLLFFRLMYESNPETIPRFWEKKEDIPDENFPIVCRTHLAGHSGSGIVIANTRDELVDCKLYVQYVKKKDEYRVHIGRRAGPDGDEASYHFIAIQRKALRTGHQNPNFRVRNLAGGFIYRRNEINPPPSVLAAAEKALAASGLDFGAVDVIWNAQQEKALVLEINTAPGLEGQTIEDYARFFKKIGGNTLVADVSTEINETEPL